MSDPMKAPLDGPAPISDEDLAEVRAMIESGLSYFPTPDVMALIARLDAAESRLAALPAPPGPEMHYMDCGIAGGAPHPASAHPVCGTYFTSGEDVYRCTKPPHGDGETHGTADGPIPGATASDPDWLYERDYSRAAAPPGDTPGYSATNGVASWPITLLHQGWCFHYGVPVEHDRNTAGDLIDHYDPANPCPGPHGEMYAAIADDPAAAPPGDLVGAAAERVVDAVRVSLASMTGSLVSAPENIRHLADALAAYDAALASWATKEDDDG